MHFFRSGVLWFAGFLLSVVLVVIPFVVVFQVIFGSPQAIKRSLQDSGAYQQFVPAVLDSSTQDQTRRTLQNKDVRQAVQAAVPAQLVQSLAEQIIDQTYAWLRKPTLTPEVFSVSTTPLRSAVEQGLHSYALQRASNLPTCTLSQLGTLQSAQDILNAQCLPPGLDPTAAANSFTTTALTDLQLPATIRLDVNQLPAGDGLLQTSTIAQRLHGAYQLLTKALWPLIGSALLLGGLIVGLAANRWQATARLGRALVIQGGLLAVVAGLLFLVSGSLTAGKGATDSMSNPALQQAVNTALSHLVRIGALGLLATGGGYMLVGGGGLVAAWQQHQRDKSVATPKEAIT